MTVSVKKPVCLTGFFYAESVRVFLTVFLCGGSLLAQIELPDTGEEAETEEQNPAPLPEPPDEEETQRIIRELSRQGRIPSGGIQDQEESVTDDRELKEQEARYTLVPEFLRVTCQLDSGLEIWGRVRNQSFRVRNNAGAFPVLLHEIESMKKKKDRGGVSLWFPGGDRLSGLPDLELISVLLPDGGVRQLRINEINELRVFLKE